MRHLCDTNPWFAMLDACLAAFAIRGNCRLLTFDQGFTRFEREGLDLLLLP